MITRLKLKDFRGIAEGDIKDFSQVNLLLGPNNAGKTTILEAIYLAATADVGCLLDFREPEQVSFPATVTAEQDMLGLHPIAHMLQRYNFPQVCNSLSFPLAPTLHGYTGDEPMNALMRLHADRHDQHPLPPFVHEYWGMHTYPKRNLVSMRSSPNCHYVFCWYPEFTYM